MLNPCLMNVMKKQSLGSDPHNNRGKKVKWVLFSSLGK